MADLTQNLRFNTATTKIKVTPDGEYVIASDYLQMADLIQNLSFNTATTKIKVTPDGEYVIASGVYPPQVKVFEVKQYSLKFERHLVSEIINFQVLDNDYSKIAFMCADRYIRLHAKYGSHYSLRIPRMGRDIAFDSWTSDLLCAASSTDIYRINLQQGRFLSSLNTQSPAINVVSQSTIHRLIACGGDDGAVECFDVRTRSSAGRINAVASTGDIDQEVTSLQFDEVTGHLMAVGNSAGKVAIYDIRMSDPIRVKDHMYGSPILSIKWHQTLNSAEPKLISADNHIVRIWDPNTGNNLNSIEPNSGTINDICIFSESGLMFFALDDGQIPTYFIPALGPAPKWCPHLENLTEEMEKESESNIYDNYKFLTKEDIAQLNLTNLIGTNLLRAYMHGFLIDYRLYKKAQSFAYPSAYDDYIKKQKQEMIEAQRASRVTVMKKLPKVNRQLAARLLENLEAEGEMKNADDTIPKKKSSKKNKGSGNEMLKDERFRAMFKDQEFEVDEMSDEYRALHPQSTKQQSSLIQEHFEPIMEEDVESVNESDADSQPSEPSDFDEDIRKLKNTRRPRLYEVKDDRHAEAFWSRVSLANEDSLPLGERVASLQQQQAAHATNDVKIGTGGSREITFTSRSSTKHRTEEPREGKRRGVQSLGLKPDKAEFYSSGRRGGRGRGRGGGRGGRSRGRGRR